MEKCLIIIGRRFNMEKLNLTAEAKEYYDLLDSGMFWEFYPQLSGTYNTDKNEWKLIYEQLQKSRKCQIKN